VEDMDLQCFQFLNDRTVERWQGERFEFVRRMGQIFVAMLFA